MPSINSMQMYYIYTHMLLSNIFAFFLPAYIQSECLRAIPIAQTISMLDYHFELLLMWLSPLLLLLLFFYSLPNWPLPTATTTTATEIVSIQHWLDNEKFRFIFYILIKWYFYRRLFKYATIYCTDPINQSETAHRWLWFDL